MALHAFEEDRARGRRHTHVVAPPGSGKTLLGAEIVRRLGRQALVLVPNTAVQAQWVSTVARFAGADGIVGTEPAAPIAVLTYQSLCRLDNPAVVLGEMADRRWADERARATGATPDEVEREARGFTGEAAERRRREIGRISAGLKREIANAAHGDLHLGHLLSSGARERVEALRARGVDTLVLDECHHLASLWGYVVRAVVEELGDPHLVGLTATHPDELTTEEAELYEGLLGPVDFTVPTPAVVKDGHLAPFQELAWLTTPLDAERLWLAERDLRFRELVTALHDDPEGPLSFPGWVLTRMRGRESADGESRMGWASFERRHPALARAGARFISSAGLALPDDAPRGEGYREQPDLDDWLVLLSDYALRCLRVSPLPEAAERDRAVAAALRDLGFTLTRQGIRRGRSDVDRLLTASAAKAIALVEVVGAEYDARGDALRALVLTDGEQAPSRVDEGLAGVLRADAGTAPAAVRALADNGRTAPLCPLLVSGRGLRCAPGDAKAVVEALAAGAEAAFEWRVEMEDEDGLVRIVAGGGDWSPRVWVALATVALAAGSTQVLVGTRALLGEGWDAPCVNCLVDLTEATTRVSVTQMRGRSLRLDPADPEKIASNWDIVCVAPELARGDADYHRFVRKHRHLFAPTEDGAIEAGPGHVHPVLGPFQAPEEDVLAEMNRDMTRRAAEHRAARERWAIGGDYRGEEHDTLVVRGRRHPVVARVATEPPAYPVSQRLPIAVGGAGVVVAGLSVLVVGVPALAALAVVPAALLWAGRRLGRTAWALQVSLPLDLAAAAVCECYVRLGELRPEAAASLAVEPRASGFLRVWLRTSTEAESARVAQAIADLIEPPTAPRYVVSRLVPDPVGTLRRVMRVLARRPPFAARTVAVPDDLAGHKPRAEAFAHAFSRWVGPTALTFTQRTDEGRSARAALSGEASDYELRRRRVWV